MRRRRIGLMGVGLLVALGGLSLPWGRAPRAEDVLGCSLATLRGTYLFAYEGFTVDNGRQIPVAYAGQEVYDGDGIMTGVYSVSTNGTITRNIPYTGTYTVNGDCTGTLTTTEERGTFQYDQFVGLRGDEFSWVATDPGIVVSGFERRVSVLTPPPSQGQ